MLLLFVYLGFNFMVTVFGFTFFWKLFPKNRMEATSRPNADLKKLDSENNNTIESRIVEEEDRKCR